MTTLEAIGFTVAGGGVIFTLSFAIFGVAVRARSVFIAPRCTARPRNTIYNPRPAYSSQNRGNAWWGWMSWVCKFSYGRLLAGIPGTGTRKGGIEGDPLKVNMDGIVLLRYHTACLKVSVLATLLCVGVILPVNLSGRCFNVETDTTEGCSSEFYNLTNYERTTLANIPSLSSFGSSSQTVFGAERDGTVGRLYGIVLCTWVICAFSCLLLRREWVEMLAMRRVYYLEYDHWAERKKELQKTLMQAYEDSVLERSRKSAGSTRSSIRSLRQFHDPDPVRDRDPWIPHPEQKETVPNIALYSVLVGGLPSAPNEEVDDEDLEKAVRHSKNVTNPIDWQLTFCGEYFDRCVPNQPGFSSSVAAITVLPSAPELASAWSKWYKAAGKLRRLRFIRSLIKKKLHYDIADDFYEMGEVVEGDENNDDEADGIKNVPVPGSLPHAMNFMSDYGGNRPIPRNSSSGSSRTSEFSMNRRRTASEVYRDTDANKEYYQDVFGASWDENDAQPGGGGQVVSHFDFGGPEQTAVYSREFAQSAAACCPHGCCEEVLLRAGIDELREMELEALQDVHAANLLLKEAQRQAIIPSDSLHSLSERDRKFLKAVEAETKSMVAATDEGVEFVLNNDAMSLGAVSLASRSHLNAHADNEMFRGVHMHRPGSIRYRPGRSERPPSDNKSSGRPDFAETEEWALVDSIVADPANDSLRFRGKKGKMHAMTGVFFLPSWKTFFKSTYRGGEKIVETGVETPGLLASKVADTLVRESTYAVVTFTSRQAAVAARQCLADGRAFERWRTYDAIPVPPLADAAPYQLCPCRGCCRPVTISINNKQKLFRKYYTYLFLATIYCFYTFPLAFATSLIDPSRLNEVFPGYEDWVNEQAFLADYLTGIVPALIWTIFFALCPVIFKMVANFGSNAASVYAAEYKAMQYFWWFMILTAFSGQSLAQMVLSGFNEGLRIGAEAQNVLIGIANSIPTVISAQWLNWIIVRTTITLPLNYMLQVNTYLFHCLGWNCCSRVVRGGGPGGPTPYRVYIDSGVVFLCTVALSPASPLVAPFALIYYLYCMPLFRRNLIFMYRPKYDSGGLHWPFLFDMLVSSMIAGQLLVTTMIALKRAVIPAIMAGLPMIALFIYRKTTRDRFLRPFLDASLYTTSQLDGWDITETTSMEKREEFRQFLVDSHKAAYVPVCLANSEDVLTVEPAVVVRQDHDEDSSPALITPSNLSRSRSERSDIPIPQKQLPPRKVREPKLESSSNLSHGSNSASLSRGIPSVYVPVSPPMQRPYAMRQRTDSVASLDSQASAVSAVSGVSRRSQVQYGVSLRRISASQLQMQSHLVANPDDGSVTFEPPPVPPAPPASPQPRPRRVSSAGAAALAAGAVPPGVQMASFGSLPDYPLDTIHSQNTRATTSTRLSSALPLKRDDSSLSSGSRSHTSGSHPSAMKSSDIGTEKVPAKKKKKKVKYAVVPMTRDDSALGRLQDISDDEEEELADELFSEPEDVKTTLSHQPSTSRST